MENKEIIIDGVNVSECECFSKYGHSCDLMRPFGFCSQWVNCYYKQLKRKEQECERLKKELETVYDDCKGCPTCNEALYNANLYAKEYRKLKQTLAKIKEICNSVENIENVNSLYDAKLSGMYLQANKILQKISESEV